MKHVPPHDVVTAMFDHLVALCQTPGEHLNTFEALLEKPLHLGSRFKLWHGSGHAQIASSPGLGTACS